MADRPILFSAPMIRAILDGRKTQTRRVIKNVPPQPEANCHPHLRQKHPAPYLDAYCSERKTAQNPRGMSNEWCWWQVDNRQCAPSFKVPYQPGDRLWVREAVTRFDRGTCDQWVWYRAGLNDIGPCAPIASILAETGLNGEWPLEEGPAGGKPYNVPSIHMPRWASRITLYVTEVRVERLNSISEADAIAEGIEPEDGYWRDYLMPATQICTSPVESYRTLWESINGAGSWAENPWVAAYTFAPLPKNIDAAPDRLEEVA